MGATRPVIMSPKKRIIFIMRHASQNRTYC
jgi:hypothetical protein